MTRFSAKYAVIIALTAQILMIFGYHLWQKRAIPKTARIGIVNLVRVQKEARIYQKIHEIIDREHQKIHDEVLRMEKDLRHKYEQIKMLKNRKKVEDSRKELDKQASKVEQALQQERERLNKKVAEFEQIAEKKLQSAVNDVVRKNQINLLLNTNVSEDSNIIVYAEGGYNLTDDLIARLNKEEIESA